MDLSLPSTSTATVTQVSNPFLLDIEHQFQRVLKYEDKLLKIKARSYIPVERLEIKAIERIRLVQKGIKLGSKENEISYNDAFLVELLNWFKTEFFNWVDTPPCSFCTGETKTCGMKVVWHCGDQIRVEQYKCTLCDTMTDFPRYNDPATLLATREGRCGEFANCFTLMCRTLNYDARYVLDNTDHVWTEVYSHSLRRWLHCDPCENAVDTPLMYECGWGKKLVYIMAYSKDDIQDVTWRYSCNHKDVLSRRKQCKEKDLIDTMIKLRDKRWATLSVERVNYIRKRLCIELVELMNEKIAGEQEKVGRLSGSLSWRLYRKEVLATPFVWIVENDDETCLRYQSTSDLYEVATSDGRITHTINKWHRGVYCYENIFRKEETDWKMVYLAREEKSENAKITWKIKAGDAKVIKKLRFKVISKEYHSGKVEWSLQCGDDLIKIPKDQESDFTYENVDNLSEFNLTAHLSGGDGDTSWQHSQIFRQELNSKSFPMEIYISAINDPRCIE